MDEPFSSLDPKLRDEMGELIKKIKNTTGITIIFVTHDRSESLLLSDSIALLINGQFVQIDSPSNMYYKQKNMVVARYLGDFNFIQGKLVAGMFVTPVGKFQVNENRNDITEVMIRTHQIKINDKKSDFKIDAYKVAGKTVT